MHEAIQNRKGARTVQGIPEEVLTLLNKGEIETVNLTEWLAIDHVLLIKYTHREIGLSEKVVGKIAEAVQALKKPTAMNSTKTIGAVIYKHYQHLDTYPVVLKKLSEHPADAIRCYATYLIAIHANWDIEEKLRRAQSLVADKHFGVREVVWMALRPEIEKHLSRAMTVLTQWSTHPDEYVRRFTTEATRPRGVWCQHIEALKEEPSLALLILENLKADPAKYVQDSVGNWLNDASKS